MESSTIEPPKHHMKVTDQIHLNPAYLYNENKDEQQIEHLWSKHTKL